MKKIYYTILILLFNCSCEEVISVDLPTDQSRISIDALIRVNPNEVTTNILVKTSLTSSFFEEITPLTVSSIIISNATESIQTSLTETEKGIYVTDITSNLLKESKVTLTIIYNNETYIASATYMPSAPIDSLIQGEGTLFAEDETEIIITYTDTPDMENYYLFDFDFNEYLVSEDTFYKGEQFQFSYFYDADMTIGKTAVISIIGIDENFYNYMNQIIVQSGGNQGPFQTPAGTVRGNFVNTTNTDNFALGYFSISETYKQSLTIE